MSSFKRQLYKNCQNVTIHHVRNILFLCPCDKIFDNHFWNHLDCCMLFPQDDTLKYFTLQISNRVNFENFNKLIAHVTIFKCNHHRIIAKCLQCYAILKDDRSVSIHQMKDVTSAEMIYIY